ncbi:MAG: hypothetical protein PHN19_01565 [Patescibacteria group bacterium]|nr:hypothetical protein [Patescibacteria group bacterium]
MKNYASSKTHHGKVAYRTSHRLRVAPPLKLKRERDYIRIKKHKNIN